MDLKFLSETPLFRGAAPQEVGEMLSCLGGAALVTVLELIALRKERK